LAEPHKVQTVSLDRQGISDNVVPVECNTSRKRITDTPSFPYFKLKHRDLSAGAFGASCASRSLAGISMSISESILLRSSDGMAESASKLLKSKIGMPISRRNESDSV
jgi:hypothetical protein